MWRLRTFSTVACLALPAWGGPIWTPKNWFFERFCIIKSNWKSSSLFLVFISSCLLLPDPSLGQMKKCTTSLYSWPYWWPYWVCFFLHLTSYINILCISRPMVLTNAVVSNTCEGYVHLVLWLAWHCRRGVDPYEPPKNWFFERFYIIKSNWKSSSLFLVFILSCLLLPDPSLEQMKKCTTSLYSWPYWWPYWVCFFLHLTSYNNILCISRPMVLTNAVVSNTCEGYVHLVLWLAWHCRHGVDPYERQKIDFLKGFT